MKWIDQYGDADGDGFVEYARATERGLANQGWKDSHDSVFHADGSLADGPIALSEVQGYVYAAKHHAAELADALGDRRRGRSLRREAERLHEAFERTFWCDDLGTYALALDGHKRPCRVVSSNAAQCLISGIAVPDRARRIAETVMRADMFSGWGVRTIREGEARYNPMAYHNGSIWPHDTALVALGLARYGLKDPVVRLAEGLFAASQQFGLRRLPELFCGFPRLNGEPPTRYPTACAPQAWASASAFLIVQALLGLEVDGRRKRVTLRQPRLPADARVAATDASGGGRRRSRPAVRAARRRRRHQRRAAHRRRQAGDREVASPRRRRQRRKARGNPGALAFEPRRQHQRLAQVLRVLVDGKARAIGGQFEQHAAWLEEVDRLEPEAIDHRRRTPSCAVDLRAHGQLLDLVGHPPRQVVNAADAPGAAARVGRHFPDVHDTRPCPRRPRRSGASHLPCRCGGSRGPRSGTTT